MAVYLRIVVFLGPGLGEYIYKSITGPFMLAAMYGRNISPDLIMSLITDYMQILFWRFMSPRSNAVPAICARLYTGRCYSCVVKRGDKWLDGSVGTIIGLLLLRSIREFIS